MRLGLLHKESVMCRLCSKWNKRSPWRRPNRSWKGLDSRFQKRFLTNVEICWGVWKCCVPLNPMVLLIIIPFLNGYNWEYTLFSDKPICWGLLSSFFTCSGLKELKLKDISRLQVVSTQTAGVTTRSISVEARRTWSLYIFTIKSSSDQRNIMEYLIEGSLEVKLPTIWTVEKQRWEESEEKRSEERRSEEKESEERRCRCAKR